MDFLSYLLIQSKFTKRGTTMKHIRENRFWIITGLETFVLGLLFALENNFIDAPPHMPTFVRVVDDPPFAIVLMIIGFYVFVVSSTQRLDIATYTVINFILTSFWTFYFIIFMIHDITGPFLVPRYTTVMTGFIVFRIMGESFLGQKR